MTCEQLGTVKSPTLLITGGETLPVFAETAEIIAGCIPNAEIHTIEGVGHGGPIMKRDAFLSAVLDFVGRN